MPSRTDRRDAVSLAAAVSNFQIDFIEGVGGGSVPDNALPPEGSKESVNLSKGVRGSWRSHMNALQDIVHENISTAMIFENDVDWDIRDFHVPKTIYPPYVDEINLLPINPNDETVPLPKYLRAHPFGPLDALATSFHHIPVSITAHQGEQTQFGISKWSRIWDVEIGDCCAGQDSNCLSGEMRCFTSQPPTFAYHHPDGGESKIGGLGGGYANGVETKYLRKSVRMNLGMLMRGGGFDEMDDQWPDEGD
ncbi:hypothetical protein HYFRA_00002130 [Hymenoscyphus fraxineus]|uniref:Glycosyltransferase family 25 protein n=1 Tax=Hymenoscyphus fraxineus TaxID=746836 RepID=A0A9N9KP16_9HELO|nr:hypothetical protein HYFRA_00002130 [Hymenoscyphus fraxineus]